mmetsp:Transcript_30033/g.77812  ORF Transcript_30033/g.77812 Transcript_30033/m.77812 type:complete len:207 (-) Transcript_30033:502-1122(-)
MPPLGPDHTLGTHPITSKGSQIDMAGPSGMRSSVHWRAGPAFPPHPSHMRTPYASLLLYATHSDMRMRVRVPSYIMPHLLFRSAAGRPQQPADAGGCWTVAGGETAVLGLPPAGLLRAPSWASRILRSLMLGVATCSGEPTNHARLSRPPLAAKQRPRPLPSASSPEIIARGHLLFSLGGCCHHCILCPLPPGTLAAVTLASRPSR